MKMTTAQPEPAPVSVDNAPDEALDEPLDDALDEALDPAKHMINVKQFDSNGTYRPITLTHHARELRRELANDRLWPSGPGRPARNVVVTEIRAVVIASLLEELAARLRPGPAFGSGTEGGELACVVADLAAELLDQAFA